VIDNYVTSQRVDTKPSNPKDAAATARLDLSLFPATARAYGALAMTEGDLKYGAYNYRAAGVNASIYYAAAGRHLDKWYNGEECDQKTKVPHLASALASIAVLIDGIEKGNWTDDRPPTLDQSALLDRFEKTVRHLQEIFPRRTGRYTKAKQEAQVGGTIPAGSLVEEVHGELRWRKP
jgi:hypothetical protein